MWLLLLIVVVGGVIAFYVKRFTGKKKAFASLLAANPDFNPEYVYHTVLAVDTKSKRLILSSNDSKYRIVHLNDISTIQKQRIRNQYQILFVIKDFEAPQVGVPFANSADRDLWYDRIMILGVSKPKAS